ncbi:hypothetical protein ACFFTN_01295 [Aminobacter aganoensis]|uniref:Transcriptional regulator n=1 Tax=Aminobacter aganoensis TaxID=83264 RepID=A0A7X0KJY5_9HYPH|nr:hypothetical protein [Aminobacter aganoensis]MBB6353506.1 hypothetical protein [Aminobacter aganoensis]
MKAKHPSPCGEILLSYLTGLAPVGNLIEIPRKHVAADLGYRAYGTFHSYLNQLIARGYVRRVACGNAGSTGLLVVLRRLEDA